MPGPTETYAVTSLYPTVTRALQEIIAELSTNSSATLHRSCIGNFDWYLDAGVDFLLEFREKMVGVARIELATPAMSTQCSTTELHAHAAVP
jgi:hypothetical protein